MIEKIQNAKFKMQNFGRFLKQTFYFRRKGMLFLLILLTFHFALLTSVSAHMAGEPPFFKVNGQYSPYYPVPTTSIPDFNLPQDIAPENFIVGENIDFEIETSQLQVPSEIVQKTKFIWDFGDGQTATGIKNSHKYEKSGSHILTIKADAGDSPGPQVLQTTLINVIPDKNYVLPKAIILVNGWQSKDPLIDILEDNFDKEYKFDGTKSDSGSSRIVTYTWDFGDGSSATGPKVSHKFTTNPYTVFPILRVKTADGFISDNFIQIKDKGALTGNPGSAAKSILSDNPVTGKPNMLRYLLVGLGVLVGIYLVSFIIMKLKRKR